MATMKTLNGYGFNATELNGKNSDSYLQLGDDAAGSTGEAPKINADTLGGVDASNYLKKTDTASDTSKLGGKAPEYYLQPRNLLDNSDFTNLVNQRGITSETSVSAYSYFIDRWVNQTSEARSFTLSTSGIGLPLTTTLLQKIEKIEAGKIVTFAIKLSDGTIATLTGTVQYTGDGAWMRFASIAHSFGDMYMETMNGVMNVVVYNTKVITIEWAALYEGSYTAETLPPYVPKGYTAELVECMRYYYRLQNGTNFIFRLRNQHETNNYAAFDICPCITFPVPMRIVPTVSISYDITDGILSVGAPFDCSRTSCTVPDVSIPHGGWFDLNSLIASADL